MKPRVALFSTGGTIASIYDPGRRCFVPALSGAQLVDSVPQIKELAEIEVEEVANVDSSQMTPSIWCDLARRVNAHLAHADVAGAVVTHGTDTLEETAYFLDLTVCGDKPVVLVGAQRAPSFPDTDGPRNLYDAVRVAVSPDAAGKGALVVMNGQINAAREVSKTNSIQREAFQCLEFGALGVADLQAVRFYRAPLRRQTILLPADTSLGRVEIILHYAGADGMVLRALLAHGGADGLVIAATGLGNVSDSMFEAIAEARRRGIPVVISTRVYTGRVLALYGSDGAGVSLVEAGCVLADNLSPWKARVLLMLALTQTREPAALQRYFEG